MQLQKIQQKITRSVQIFLFLLALKNIDKKDKIIAL
jgi:hypothetical protein